MPDLNLDDLANCPTPDDAGMLLSPGTAELMETLPDTARLEVYKTIVALGDVVARTHAPNIAAIKLSLREDGGIEATAEANGRVFHRRNDNGVIAGITGAVSSLARMESKQRKGNAHAGALDAWGQALIEAGQYLVEIAILGRGIAHEMKQEAEPVRDAVPPVRFDREAQQERRQEADPKPVDPCSCGDGEWLRNGVWHRADGSEQWVWRCTACAEIKKPRRYLEMVGALVEDGALDMSKKYWCNAVHNPTDPEGFNCVLREGHEGDCSPKPREKEMSQAKKDRLAAIQIELEAIRKRDA